MSSTITRNVLFALCVTLCTLSLYIITTPQAQAATDGVTNRVKTERGSSTKVRASVDMSCMATAVSKREADLLSAWTKLTDGIAEALTERSDALVAAWNSTNTKDAATASKTAWSTWKTEKAALHKTFKSDRKAAWDSFKTTAKSECKVTLPKEENLEKTASDSVAI